jgi:hypothetical protein
MKVFVIGSLSCEEEIRKVAKFFKEEMGDEVDYVRKQPEKPLEILIREAFESISKADRVVAVKKTDGTFGDGTLYEMTFANFIGKPITKFGKTDIELISQKGSNTLPEWIYSPVNDLKWDDLFEQIERALGFKLFIWQKTYIMGIGFRRSGQTTAEILRLLVGNTVLPYIRLERPKSKQEDLKQKELIKIKEKLDSKGIISRNIEREYY